MANPNDISYEQGLPISHLDQAAELYESAFGKKCARAIPEKADRLALIRNGFQSGFAFVALDDSRLVGLAGYHTANGSLTGGITARAIMRSLGLIGGIRACCIFSLYDRTPAAGELVMDGIAVDANYRGRGLGTELLKRIIACARAESCRKVRLDVIDTNPKARNLYERFGFKVTREEQYPYLAGVLGFGGSATMEYEIV